MGIWIQHASQPWCGAMPLPVHQHRIAQPVMSAAWVLRAPIAAYFTTPHAEVSAPLFHATLYVLQ